jgi:hypothetical protein
MRNTAISVLLKMNARLMGIIIARAMNRVREIIYLRRVVEITKVARNA